jgi:DNA-binding Lrp family transcriptional regulator
VERYAATTPTSPQRPSGSASRPSCSHQEDQATVVEFETQVAAIAQIVAAQRLFGEPDYLLRVVAADLDSYRRLYDEHLASLPGVQRLTSTLVMKDLVGNRGLPL